MAMRAAIFFAGLGVASAGIYPDGHFDHVFKATTDNFEAHVKTEVDAGRTLFAPAWNSISDLFKDNKAVSFADINLSEQQINGAPYCDGKGCDAGAGGWPTVRYFNKKTGLAGEAYKQKTDKAMCDELGNEDYMTACVTENGSTSLCNVADGEGCNEKEVKFIAKWKAGKTAADIEKQITRLDGMKDKPMTPDLKKWISQRLAVLGQLQTSSKSEL